MYNSLESGQHDSTAAAPVIYYVIDSIEIRLQIIIILGRYNLTVVKSEYDPIGWPDEFDIDLLRIKYRQL